MFTLIIEALISGVLMPDRWGRGFNIGWGLAWVWMVFDMTLFARGSMILTLLFHDMHQVVYMRG